MTSDARALVCKVDEIPELANPGRGVIVIKAGDAAVVGFGVGAPARQGRRSSPRPTTARSCAVGPGRFSVTARGGKGHALKRKTKIVRVSTPLPPAPRRPC